MKGFILGIDIGGTFTDIVYIDLVNMDIRVNKVLTDIQYPDRTFTEGVMENVEDPSRIELITHGTTLGSNMLLGQTGLERPRSILITNRGFEDVIEIGRQNRPELYNIFFERPKPLIERRFRIGVSGRIDGDGKIVQDVDINEIRDVIKNYRDYAEVYIISLLNSYINPIHEIEIEKEIRNMDSGKFIVSSHKVDPRPGEYERTVSAVINGLLKPITSRYLNNILDSLEKMGYKKRLLVMTSNGGVVDTVDAIERPAYIIESGPAAGAIATAYLARLLDIDRMVSLDMGGTTSKATTIIDGEALVTMEYEVGGKVHMGRVVKGSGYPLRIPHIDIAEIGVGGGSIIWLDEGGYIHVGPLSAGSDPGPACYGRGGTEPTLTDAYSAMNWIPDMLGGERLKINRELALKALEKIAEERGENVYEVAYKAVELANELLYRAISIVTLERGYDIKDFTITTFGGAGPIHSTFLIELGFKEAVVPIYAGVFSALGLVLTDYKYTFYRGVNNDVNKIRQKTLDKLFNEMEKEAYKYLNDIGFSKESIRFNKYLEMKYRRQGKTLLIPYDNSLSNSIERFEEIYLSRYGYIMDETPYIETCILEAIAENEKPILYIGEKREYMPEPEKLKRAFYGEYGWLETGIYIRGSLKPGAIVEGPAIIWGVDSTILIRPDYRGEVDEYGNIVIKRG